MRDRREVLRHRFRFLIESRFYPACILEYETAFELMAVPDSDTEGDQRRISNDAGEPEIHFVCSLNVGSQ